MWLEVQNNYTRIVRATPAERGWLRDYLTFEDATARFRGAKKGTVCMLNTVTEEFPTGYVSLVQKASRDPESTQKREGVTIDLIDKRVVPALPDPSADLAWLRDYQSAGVARAFERRRGVLWLSTGAGKTEIAVAVSRSLDCMTLFLVHRTSLAQQAAERFDLRNAEHGVDLGPAGVIGEGSWVEGERFTCATFQTLFAALKGGGAARDRALALLGRAGVLIVDESHVLPADSFWQVAMSCNAYYRFGLSGTPLARGDRKSIYSIGCLGPVIYRVKPQVLVEAGVLARPTVRLAECEQAPSGAPLYAQVYRERIASSSIRNRLLVELATRAEKPAFLFVKEIQHGRTLTKMLNLAGIRAEFVWGKHSTEWRRNLLAQLMRGEFEVLVCSTVFQEGIDAPDLRSVIIGSAGKSTIAALQRIGRGMRVAPGKTGFEVWDIYDKGTDVLESHSRARLRAYAAEGHPTTVERILSRSHDLLAEAGEAVARMKSDDDPEEE